VYNPPIPKEEAALMKLFVTEARLKNWRDWRWWRDLALVAVGAFLSGYAFIGVEALLVDRKNTNASHVLAFVVATALYFFSFPDEISFL
jgi:uncharacterized protein involved in response to NO